MIEFFSGAVTLAQLIAGIFFLKFWRRTGDRLFLSFALAFWLLALSQTVGGFVGVSEGRKAAAYVPRVLGYLLILMAIIRTNLGGQGRQP